jgi:hypothetical protein
MWHVRNLPFCRHACFQLPSNLYEKGDGVLIVVESVFIRLRHDHTAKKRGKTRVYQIEVLWVLWSHTPRNDTLPHTHARITHTLRKVSGVFSALGVKEDWPQTSLPASLVARASDICLTDSSRWRQANGISCISSSSCLHPFLGDASSGTSGSVVWTWRYKSFSAKKSKNKIGA